MSENQSKHERFFSWYDQKRKELAKRAKLAKFALYFVITVSILIFTTILIVGTLAIYFNIYLLDASEGRNTGAGIYRYLVFMLASILLIGLTLVVKFLVENRKHNIFLMKKALKLYPLPEEAGSVLYSMLEQLKERMQIRKQVNIWLSDSACAAPSIEVYENEANLFVPIGYLMTLNSDPEKARAILAHELGHILQEDSELFLVADTQYRYLRNIFGPILILQVLVKVVFLDQVQISWVLFFLPEIIVGLLMTFGFGYFRKVRRDSELLADACAYYYAGKEQIEKVLKALPGKKPVKDYSTHPSTEKRLNFVTEISKAFDP